MNRWIGVASLLWSAAALAQESPNDGQVKIWSDGDPVAWDSDAGAWVDLVSFWESYAQRRGGITWGRGSEYPPYDQLKELDTFMVEVESGPCLMEFFHERWRRANDVRRWDPAFNEFGGCPDVFD